MDVEVVLSMYFARQIRLVTLMQRILFFLLFSFSLSFVNAQWTQASPEQGSGFDLEHVDGEIWLSTIGGLFVSSDEGESWLRSTLLPTGLIIHELEVIDDDVFIVASRNFILPGGFAGGVEIYRKRSGERSFQRFEFKGFYPIESRSRVRDTELVKHRGDLFLIFQEKLYSSSDDGETWSRDFDLGLWRPTELFSNESVLIMDGRISRDKGMNWENFAHVEMVAGDTIFTSYPRLRYTLDLGQTWQNANPSELPYSVTRTYELDESSRVVFMSSSRDAFVLSGVDVVERLIDIEDSIIRMNNVYGVNDILRTLSGDYIFVGESGVYKYYSGSGLLGRKESELFLHTIYGFNIAPNGDLLVLGPGHEGESIWSRDHGESWLTATGESPIGFIPGGIQDFVVWPGLESDVFKIYQGTRVRSTTDGGVTYVDTPVSTPLDNPFSSTKVYVSGDKIYEYNDYAVIMTRDFGSSWDTLYFDQSSQPFLSRKILSVHDVGDFQLIIHQDSTRISFDEGITWTAITSNSYLSTLREPRYRNSSAFSSGEEHVIQYFDSFYDRWIVSKDNGVNWNFIRSPEGLESSKVVDFFKLGDDYYVRLQYKGIYVSNRLEGPYSPLNEGLLNRNILVSRHTDSELFVSTFGGGIWRHDGSFNRAGGVVFEDENENFLYDVDDSPLGNILILSNSNDVAAVSRA